MRTFYSAQEIEDLARQGTRELVIDDSVVLTDLARQTAALLGIRLVAGGRPRGCQHGPAGEQPAPAPLAADGAARPIAPIVATAPLPSRPRGCQHGPAGERPALAAGAAGGSDGTASGKVVEDLVGLVTKMSKR